MKVTLTGDGIFVQRTFTSRLRAWQDVKKISAHQIDRITYFENFLVFEFTDGSSVAVGELEAGAANLDQVLKKFGVERDWYGELETGGPGTTISLYTASGA